MDVQVAVVVSAAVVAALLGWLMPRWVARLPEPEPIDAEKTPYPELAATPGLTVRYAVAAAVVAGVLAAVLGPDARLLFLVPLSALGVALAQIDFRTRLLPKRLVLPAYPAMLVGLALAAVLRGELELITGGLLGGVIAWAIYWLLWRFTPGMGFGDVRLSGIVGMALGAFGWHTLGYGLYAAFVVGALGWIPLRLMGFTKDRHFAFGPFMLLGAVVGICLGALT
ncbi:prepilin peptidase [Nocardioides sp. Bht2]|uniref:prepilin peptidase n=1 Tax=Nocardioides sp. Bht2 TaxID=3392297 RepID=UPI0039B58FC6